MRCSSGAAAVSKLVVYVMCGPETPELAEAAVEGGADLVELGFPFSDPLADGPVIRRAAERALAQGMRTGACLETLAATRERLPETPLVPMTYSSLLEAYGWERFADDARAAGATSGRGRRRSCRSTRDSGSPPPSRRAPPPSSRTASWSARARWKPRSKALPRSGTTSSPSAPLWTPQPFPPSDESLCGRAQRPALAMAQPLGRGAPRALPRLGRAQRPRGRPRLRRRGSRRCDRLGCGER